MQDLTLPASLLHPTWRCSHLRLPPRRCSLHGLCPRQAGLGWVTAGEAEPLSWVTPQPLSPVGSSMAGDSPRLHWTGRCCWRTTDPLLTLSAGCVRLRSLAQKHQPEEGRWLLVGRRRGEGVAVSAAEAEEPKGGWTPTE